LIISRCSAAVSGELVPAEFSGNDRLFAGGGVFGEVILHAGLNASASRLHIGTGALHVGFADLHDGDTAQQSPLTGFRERGEMVLDACSQPALTGLNPGAILLNLCPAALPHSGPLRQGGSGSHEKGEYRDPDSSIHDFR
jgi:hypothetical protein